MQTPNLSHPVSLYTELQEYFDNIDYLEVKSISSSYTLEHFISDLLYHHPWWVRLLFRLRIVLATLLGLKSSTASEADFNSNRQDVSFIPGSRSSIFTVKMARRDAYWLAEAPQDRHLSAWLAILAESSAKNTKTFHVITAIRYKHWTGPVYFNMIRIFHHLMLNAAMRAAAGDRQRK